MPAQTWRDVANHALRLLFDGGKRTPTKQEIFDAYPFGQRQYFPYKVWCEQVAWWKAGCPQRPIHPQRVVVPEEQGVLLI